MDGTILNKKYDLVGRIEALEEGGGGGSAEIAPQFSETSQYIYGDLVFYEGDLYRFEVEEHEPGPWNPEEVMGTNISENLVMLPGDGLRRTSHEFSVKLKSDGGLHFDENGAIYADHLPDYRLLEHKTGQQWIDGKELYSKVINFGNLPNSGEKRVASGLTDETMIMIEGFYNTGRDVGNLLNIVSLSNFVYNNTTHEIVVNTSTDLSTILAYAILYYTKSEQTSKKKK